MTPYLQVDNLTKSFGDLVLFENISFGIAEGQRIGLIAKNGTGKTTLLNILSGKEGYDSGNIVFRRDLRVDYLEQDPQYPEELTVLEACFHHGNSTVELIKEYERCMETEGHPGLDDLLVRMDHEKAWEYEQKAKQILSQLKIRNFEQQVKHLSGGQLKRVALANALITEPDLLILDEPTNHLDVASREWIEEAVESYEGNLLFVSHDRYFINRFATRIWMLENGQIIDFRGTFEEYRAAQERKRLQAAVPVKAEPEKPKKEKPRRPGGTKELEKQVAAAERAVAKAEERQYELTLKAEEVASNYLELQKVYDEQKALEEEIAALYTKWETLAAELEEARG